METHLTDVVNYIRTANNQDITIIISEINKRQNAITTENLSKYHIAETVDFATKYGTKTGVIEKINRKTITLNCGGREKWRVSPSYIIGLHKEKK